ncbi:MAG: SusD/RagB family nutrient-binding outer rane lipoprotein [Flaviaesturariibacter sp.]|nr:SusD/RagB family nutrient-binding outer rane lipoprotein [Flaviaesturariibacter sp.]
MKKYLFILLLAGTALSSCKKDFLDLNENPNFPSSVPAASLLAPAEVRTASIVTDPNLAIVQVWMGYWAFSPNYAVNQDTRDYRITNTTGQGFFTNLYTNAFDYQTMINAAVAQNNPALEGIGRTMKSFLMQYAVDVYNNVPYTEAFQGTKNQTPAYENGMSVYEKIYDDLNLAITRFNNVAAVFPTASEDIMFKGNKALWIKMANTIKLRILLRQSGRADRAAYIAAKLATDFPNGLAGFLQANESAVVNPGYTNSDNKQNPYWANFGYNVSGAKTGNNDFYRSNIYAVNFYKNQNDVRLFYVANSTGAGSFFGGNFAGAEMGTQGSTTAAYSDITSKDYRSASDPQNILSDFESLFLQSEAVARGWFPGGDAVAKQKFDQAKLQSFVFMFDRVDGAGAGASYLSLMTPTADNTFPVGGTLAEKIRVIITQKWAALNGINFIEPWAEYRRTGYPNVPLSSSASRGPRIPLRLKYPQFEYDYNGANVTAQGTIDQFTSKIWWMP